MGKPWLGDLALGQVILGVSPNPSGCWFLHLWNGKAGVRRRGKLARTFSIGEVSFLLKLAVVQRELSLSPSCSQVTFVPPQDQFWTACQARTFLWSFHILCLWVLWLHHIQDDRVVLGYASKSPWAAEVLICSLGWDWTFVIFKSSQVIDSTHEPVWGLDLFEGTKRTPVARCLRHTGSPRTSPSSNIQTSPPDQGS